MVLRFPVFLISRRFAHRPLPEPAIYRDHAEPVIVAKGKTLPPGDNRSFREIQPASKWWHSSANYNPIVSQLDGQMMKDGRREMARQIRLKVFREIKYHQYMERKKMRQSNNPALSAITTIEVNPVKVYLKAVEAVCPIVHLMPVERGGIIYQVPSPLTKSKSLHKGIQFLLEVANDKDRRITLDKTLSREIILAAKNEGIAVKKKEDLHKECEENRAYANFRRS